MKRYNVTITYTDCRQTSPDTYNTFTKVIHVDETNTLLDIINKYKMGDDTNVELHINKI
jgi:dTDP-4-dehydrorhamnose 3,5-epimerase-like enzyme